MQCSGLRARGARDDDRGCNRRDFCLADLVVLLEGFHFRHRLSEMRRSATPGVRPLTTKKQRARSFFLIVLRILRFFVVGFHSFQGVAHYGVMKGIARMSGKISNHGAASIAHFCQACPT